MSQQIHDSPTDWVNGHNRQYVQIWPAYDEYATKTDRQIPVVVLDRA